MNTFAWQPILLRKEVKQLWPLFVAIMLCLALLGLIIGWISVVTKSAGFGEHALLGYLLLLSPAMFALGAGAMAIGQEKESRTLDWLESLPVTRRQLCWNKLATSGSLLLSLWLLSALVCWIGERLLQQNVFDISMVGDQHPFASAWSIYWLVNSIYLLICSHLVAWQFGSAVASVLATIPLAIVPSLLRFGGSHLLATLHWQQSDDPTLWGSLLSLGLCLGIAICLTDRIAVKGAIFMPRAIPDAPWRIGTWIEFGPRRTSEVVLNRTSALLWQNWMQNRWVIVSLIALCAVAFAMPFMVRAERANLFIWVFNGVSFFVVCILGVMMYFGDNARDRIRFLADRGVSPSVVWWSRLVIPIAVISMLAMGIRCLAIQRFASPSPFTEPLILPLWLIAMLALFVLGHAQWWTQLVAHRVVGLIGAPLWVCLVGGWAGYCWMEVVRHPWALVPLVFAPFVATRWGMQCWMDRRITRRHYGLHGITFIICACFPFVDLAWFVASIPRIPEARRDALIQEIESYHFTTTRVERLQPLGLNDDVMSELRFDLAKEDSVDEVALLASEQQLQSLRQQLKTLQSASRDAKRMPYYDFKQNWNFVDRFAVTQAFHRLNPDHPGMRERYRLELLILFEQIKRLRRGVTESCIQESNRLEIALVKALNGKDVEELLGANDYRTMVEFCADPESRLKDRRRAILASRYQETPEGPYQHLFSNLQRWIARQRLIEHRLDLSLRLLENRESLSDPQQLLQYRLEIDNWGYYDLRWFFTSHDLVGLWRSTKAYDLDQEAMELGKRLQERSGQN